MGTHRAILLAPLAIFPVVLAFVGARALMVGDMRGAFVAPFAALLITLVGYPLALLSAWGLIRLFPALVSAGLAVHLAVGIISAETVFWVLVRPLWQQEVYSTAFCMTMLAACGALSAGLLFWLRRSAP